MSYFKLIVRKGRAEIDNINCKLKFEISMRFYFWIYNKMQLLKICVDLEYSLPFEDEVIGISLGKEFLFSCV